jgi:hypothetical protein
MSGDDADPVLVAAVLDSFVKELRRRYDEAKFGSDPVGRRAYGEVLDAVSPIWQRWAELSRRPG